MIRTRGMEPRIALRGGRQGRAPRAISLVFALALSLATGPVLRAQTPLLDEVHTIASPAASAPIEQDVSITATGSYQVQVTDLGSQLQPPATPAPLKALTVAVTFGDALVGTPLVVTGTGTLTFTASTAGTYTLHIVGTLGSPGSGPIAVQVSSVAAGSPALLSKNYIIAPPPQAVPATESVFTDSNVTVSSTGSYTLTLTDLQFPQSLASGTPTLLLFAADGSLTPVILPQSGTYSATVPLSAGETYTLYAVGQTAATGPAAGLFSVTIAPVGTPTSPVYARTVAVGATTLLGSPVLSAATNYTATLTDLQFPAAFSQLGALVVQNGASVTTLAGGATNIAGNGGTYQVFAAATPVPTTISGVTGGAGSYSLQIAPPTGAPVLSVAQAVNTPGGTLIAYTFVANIPGSGTYTANLVDLQFPTALATGTGSLAAVQGGALLGTPITGPGSLTISPAQGPLTLLAVAAGGASGSLFDVNVAASGGSGSLVFDQPQSVGAAFTAQQVSITSTGSYQVTASDLGFPAKFSQFSVITTQGGTTLGSIINGGSFNFQAMTPGTYFVSFIATPAPPDDAGTYVLNVSPASPPPTITFSADAMTVASGGTVHLTWTTQNATSCMASGGWTGSQATNGSDVTSPTISANTTFTLTCTGPGGQATQSVTVDIDSPSGSSGGKGAVDLVMLLALAGCLGWRTARLGARAARRGDASHPDSEHPQ